MLEALLIINFSHSSSGNESNLAHYSFTCTAHRDKPGQNKHIQVKERGKAAFPHCKLLKRPVNDR